MRGNFIAAWVTQQQRAFSQSTRGIMTPEDRQILEDEAEKAMVEVERAAAAKALMEAAEDWESGTVEHDEIKYTSDAPLGWSDESVVDAVMSSGPVMDWLRARAKTYRRNEEENDGS